MGKLVKILNKKIPEKISLLIIVGFGILALLFLFLEFKIFYGGG